MKNRALVALSFCAPAASHAADQGVAGALLGGILQIALICFGLFLLAGALARSNDTRIGVGRTLKILGRFVMGLFVLGSVITVLFSFLH